MVYKCGYLFSVFVSMCGACRILFGWGWALIHIVFNRLCKQARKGLRLDVFVGRTGDTIKLVLSRNGFACRSKGENTSIPFSPYDDRPALAGWPEEGIVCLSSTLDPEQ